MISVRPYSGYHEILRGHNCQISSDAFIHDAFTLLELLKSHFNVVILIHPEHTVTLYGRKAATNLRLEYIPAVLMKYDKDHGAPQPPCHTEKQSFGLTSNSLLTLASVSATNKTQAPANYVPTSYQRLCHYGQWPLVWSDQASWNSDTWHTKRPGQRCNRTDNHLIQLPHPLMTKTNFTGYNTMAIMGEFTNQGHNFASTLFDNVDTYHYSR